MKLSEYIKDKINYILALATYIIIISTYLKAINLAYSTIFIVIFITCTFFIVAFLISYYKTSKYLKNIEKTMDKLPEKYLITEILQKPRSAEKLAYYRILKKVNKSMLENVTDIKEKQKDYKEYIESWVHEIKIPITSAKLLCENNKSEITNKIDEDIEEVNNYVEQALFYARMDQVSNDFMIREINLNEVIKNVLARNKKIMIQNNMKVEINGVNINCYTDEKWLEFILNQIITNSIKYRNNNAVIRINAIENKENIVLKIKDNGIGIKKSEIDRIFDKGFTGTNGRNQKKSTGIGLYLCKRLCKGIGMEIDANSKENEYTEIVIIIPRAKKISNQ
jgi:integral membrane sensor signal transduction histidine kinase